SGKPFLLREGGKGCMALECPRSGLLKARVEPRFRRPGFSVSWQVRNGVFQTRSRDRLYPS
ncbi:MAG: hypothetical protein KC587_19430, partial [Nitrospira sp.]|nr:hypothetical protein [Nitrospira sp.]